MRSSEGRLEDLVPIRYGRMLVTPFTFYRGAAAIMASDLARGPSPGLDLWSCGDAHLLNFGAFATPERRLTFDINDFDETSVAPFEWDVKRLVASFVVASRANGFPRPTARAAARAAARTYRTRMAELAAMPVLDAWYTALDPITMLKKAARRIDVGPALRRVEAATQRSAHAREFAKLAYQTGDRPRIKDDPPLIYHPVEFEAADFWRLAEASLEDYARTLPTERRVLIERYRPVDAAIKVVGVGSVGTFCGIVLLISGAGDPLFLQFKEARPSVLEPYAGKSPFPHHGQRVVVGQRLMQAASDIFLGWFTGRGAAHRQFYMRQLRDAKVTPLVETFDPPRMLAYAQATGWTLARAHARSGDAAVLTGYMGSGKAFDDALTAFGEAYADQNERDHAALVAAVREGRLEARVGL